ncbi:hypothetical protein AcV5_001129 [Taiwanofungus camphoratus]|nr:hypothetical protein AcV5_001129 [Antrodia cinnamomea]
MVTIAVQGDGVHVLDLSTLHPAISHTLGPSTTFACPPVTRSTSVNGIQTCTTFAVIESSTEVPEEGRCKTVWIWEDELSGGVMSGGTQKKKSTVASHRIAHIYVPEELPDHVLLTGVNGDLSVADMQLNVQGSSSPVEADRETSLLKHILFPRRMCSFAPSRTAPSQGVISVSFLQNNSKLRISVIAVDQEGGTHPLGSYPINLDEHEFVDVSLSSSGYISVLTRSGSWHSYQLETLDNSTLSLNVSAEPIRLKSLTFVPTSSSSLSFSEISLMAVSSSHVLLAGITTGSGAELTLLLWDLRYSVLLASHTSSIPSTLLRDKQKGVVLEFLAAQDAPLPTQVLLVLSPHTHNGRAETGAARTSILVVPVSVPPASTIANALGRAAAGAKWLVSATQKPSPENMSPAQAKVVHVMRSAMEQKRPEGADQAFFNWVAQEEEPRQNGVSQGTETAEDPRPQLGYVFVKQVLDIVFRTPGKSSNAVIGIPYSPKVVQYLLEKRTVSAGMVEGGLFSALTLRQDWQSAVLAMQTVSDISEADIIALLHRVVEAHRKSHSSSSVAENAMEVDFVSTDLPSLPAFLSQVVRYPMSSSALRVALRQHLADAEDLICVLTVLDVWIEARCSEEVRLLPDQVKKDLHGVPIPLYTERKKDDLPPLDKVLTFLQDLLDASLLALLAHTPAHAFFRKLLGRLQPELTFISEMEQLHGPLQPFAAAHARAVIEGAQGVPKVDTHVDWRRRKKRAHEQAEMNLGLYQVEELVI